MKLPVIATVVEAYRLFFANLDVYARLIWFPAIVLFTASVYARNYLPTAYAESADALPILIGTLLEIVAWTVVTVPAMTAWYRLVVLGRDNADARLSFSIRAAEWRYLYREILLLLAVVMLGIALFTAALLAGCALFPHCIMDELAEMAAPFMNAFLVLVLLCFARLTLVFPAVAVGRVTTFGDSWRLAKENGFRLALLMLIVLLPTYMGFPVLEYAFFGGTPENEMSYPIGYLICEAIVYWFFFPAQISVIASAYKMLALTAPAHGSA